MDWKKYHRFDVVSITPQLGVSKHIIRSWNDGEVFVCFFQIEKWIDGIASSAKYAKIHTIGKTWEKRNIKVIEINTSNSKRVFFIDGGDPNKTSGCSTDVIATASS